MGLPTLTVPTFELTIPSSNKKIKCRPFLVKEEKILLTAMNTENEIEIFNAVKQIINNCIVENQNIDVDNLAVFDIEYILLRLRSRSKGELIKLKFDGIEDSECEECRKVKYVGVNINDIKVKTFPNHTNNIKLTDEIGVIMGYPKLKNIQNNLNREEDMSTIIDLIVDCIEQIYNKDEVFLKKDLRQEELVAFVDSLQSEHYDKLYDFIITIPRIEHELDLSCEVCGRKDIQIISGLQSFFL